MKLKEYAELFQLKSASDKDLIEGISKFKTSIKSYEKRAEQASKAIGSKLDWQKNFKYTDLTPKKLEKLSRQDLEMMFVKTKGDYIQASTHGPKFIKKYGTAYDTMSRVFEKKTGKKLTESMFWQFLKDQSQTYRSTTRTGAQIQRDRDTFYADDFNNYIDTNIAVR